MRKLTKNSKPTLDVDGLVFHLATLYDAIPDAPWGVCIENELAASNPVLREREKNGVRFMFIAVHPLHGIHSGAPIRSFHKASTRRIPGTKSFGIHVPLNLYAVVPSHVEKVASLIEQARANEADPVALTRLAQQMLTDGYDFTCEFVNFLRQDYDQYWLRLPEDSFDWDLVLYYSKPDQRWYVIETEEGFGAKLLRHDRAERTHPEFILLKGIVESDLERLEVGGFAFEATFADEMISTSLIELKQNRIRSAVIHAFIAFEAATKRGLESLLKGRLKGLESGVVLEAICRELNTVNLGRVVLQNAAPESKDQALDWVKLEAIHNTRNLIVHRGRRRMPAFEDIKAQVLEVRSFVKRLQGALRHKNQDRPE